jgi:hypothetical protein
MSDLECDGRRGVQARFMILATLGLIVGGGLAAQTRVHTETIRPPAAPGAPQAPTVATEPSVPVEIITDLSRLPVPVARMRERILQAARSGDLEKLLLVMQSNETLPVFSFGDEKDPIAFWKANFPDSDGVEILATLIQILETGFVHVARGTPQDMYVWPYFAQTPLKDLSREQKVELFGIVTGSDYKEMTAFGAYSFYRVGIAPDGVWHYFVAGE